MSKGRHTLYPKVTQSSQEVLDAGDLLRVCMLRSKELLNGLLKYFTNLVRSFLRAVGHLQRGVSMQLAALNISS